MTITRTQLKAKIIYLPRQLARLLMIKALLLWQLLKDPSVPLWAKAAIIATLAYFLCPLDAIPDALPGGLADDLAAMSALLSQLAAWIEPHHRDLAEFTADRWLNPHPIPKEDT